ncbi:1,4-dihydroxy-2-naphthoate polyprenyltransferase [Chloroflexi bacterium TSY]|nr:1,4-dihydroxy-2-naphthoate polyprenyltransferase [Chloroflexi bacterium TSY]
MTTQLTNTQIWITAARPRTLPLALASIGMGAFLAAAYGAFSGPITLLCVITTILLQILSNLANDYGDSVHGADHAKRQGPSRAVQSGRISRATMRRAIIIMAVLAIVSGILLVWLSLGFAQLPFVLLFLALGGAAIWAAVTYTAGTQPYGYVGLGDLSVLLFFGWLGVAGTYFLQTLSLSPDILLPATSSGLFAVAVLNVNNVRDIESDRLAGKRSIPVRIGRRNAAFYHWVLLIGGIVCALLYVIIHYRTPWQFLFIITLPLLARNGIAVWRAPANDLDPYLKQMALTSLLFMLTFGVGQLL